MGDFTPAKSEQPELPPQAAPGSDSLELFGADMLPTRPDVLQAIAERRYEHRGVRLAENEALALKMVELLMLGMGLKKIARKLGVSKHSVAGARELLVQQGKLAPYKQRIVAKLEEAIELGLDAYIAGVEDGDVSPAQTPMPTGIFWDKRALALSEPTAIVAGLGADHERQALSIENLNAWVENLKSAKPADSISTGNHEKPTETTKD